MLLIIVLLPLLLGTLATLWLGSKSRLLTALAAGLVTLASLLLLVFHAPTVALLMKNVGRIMTLNS